MEFVEIKNRLVFKEPEKVKPRANVDVVVPTLRIKRWLVTYGKVIVQVDPLGIAEEESQGKPEVTYSAALLKPDAGG